MKLTTAPSSQTLECQFVQHHVFQNSWWWLWMLSLWQPFVLAHSLVFPTQNVENDSELNIQYCPKESWQSQLRLNSCIKKLEQNNSFKMWVMSLEFLMRKKQLYRISYHWSFLKKMVFCTEADVIYHGSLFKMIFLAVVGFTCRKNFKWLIVYFWSPKWWFCSLFNTLILYDYTYPAQKQGDETYRNKNILHTP